PTFPPPTTMMYMVSLLCLPALPALALWRRRARQDLLLDQTGDGRRRADYCEPEFTEDLRPHGVVDPQHHAGDMVDLLGDLGGHDVGVVVVGDGDEHVRVLDSGRAQNVLIDAGADDHA